MSSSEVAKALIRSHEGVKPRKTTTLKDLEALLSDGTPAQDPVEDNKLKIQNIRIRLKIQIWRSTI